MATKTAPSFARFSLLVALLCVACEKPSVEAQKSSLSSDGQETAEHLMSSYEELRAALATDTLGGVPEQAQRLSMAATALAGSGPANLKPHASALSVAAAELGRQTDLGGARKAFGEVSRQIVSMLTIEPSLQKGRHVFECPMAQGYTKWVQTKERIENPYMGKAMLQCGSVTEWQG